MVLVDYYILPSITSKKKKDCQIPSTKTKISQATPNLVRIAFHACGTFRFHFDIQIFSDTEND